MFRNERYVCMLQFTGNDTRTALGVNGESERKMTDESSDDTLLGTESKLEMDEKLLPATEDFEKVSSKSFNLLWIHPLFCDGLYANTEYPHLSENIF